MIGLIRRRESLPQILALLPESRKAAVQRELKRLEGLSEPELRNRWKQLRRAETDEVSKRAAKEAGLRVDLMPPFVRAWIGERTRNA